MRILSKKNLSAWGLLFQVVLVVVVYIFYSLRRVKGHVEADFDFSGMVFYLNYVLGAMTINFWLLPQFLYKKKYFLFTVLTLVVIAVMIFIEEGVIEHIFYPTTRGLRFSSIMNNLTSILPTVVILVGFKFAWDVLLKQKELEHLKTVVKESELQFLKTQINPHFLFNNLNNLYSYALEGSPKTPEIILELSSVLRYMLYECQEEKVLLFKEVEQLENFINLSRMQIEGRGKIFFSKSNIQNEYYIAPLIFSVFIENAIKHSSSSQDSEIEIHVHLELVGNTLHFICTNTYNDYSNTNQLDKGIGLENVRKRLELLYPDKFNLQINRTDNLYEVKLNIELEAK